MNIDDVKFWRDNAEIMGEIKHSDEVNWLISEVERLCNEVKRLNQHISVTAPRVDFESELLRAEELRLWKRAEHVSGFSQDQRPRLYAQFDAQYPSFLRG